MKLANAGEEQEDEEDSHPEEEEVLCDFEDVPVVGEKGVKKRNQGRISSHADPRILLVIFVVKRRRITTCFGAWFWRSYCM